MAFTCGFNFTVFIYQDSDHYDVDRQKINVGDLAFRKVTGFSDEKTIKGLHCYFESFLVRVARCEELQKTWRYAKHGMYVKRDMEYLEKNIA